VASGALIKKKKGEGEQEIVLRLLEHVGDDAGLSQSKFAARIGIAKGLANAYFNRCLQKGWIKLRQAPRQRYLYYLTPKGFAEKARLTAQFLTSSYQFYREARADLIAAMLEAKEDGRRLLGVLGDGELAEIAAVVSSEASIEIAGFVGADGSRARLAGLPVVQSFCDLDGVDAALLATLADAKEVHAAMRRERPDVALYVPKQLRALVWD
jgi:DNA-binding MarR family transcriptional regulator